MVYPTGFGAGSAGLNGTGFQLLVVIFTEFFGVTLAQLFGALAPSIQVLPLFLLPRLLDPRVADLFSLLLLLADRDVVQLHDCHSALRYFRRRHSVPRHSGLVTSVVVRVEPLGEDHQFDAHHRTTVRPFPSFSSLKGT